MIKRATTPHSIRSYLVALLAGAGLTFWHVRFAVEPLRESPITSEKYFFAIAVFVVLSVGLIAVVYMRVTAWLTSAASTRVKLLTLGGWLAGIAILYLALFLILPPIFRDNLNRGYSYFALFGALAGLAATYDGIREASRSSNFYVAVGSALLSLVIAELGARYYVNHFITDPILQAIYRPKLLREESLRYAPHPYLSYYPRPGWVGSNGTDQHNSLGYRGEEFSRIKPDGVFRIVAVGGSTTYGIGVPDWHDSYPAQLERILRTTYGLDYVEVINAGIGGQSSFETMINVEMRVLDLDPDLIILYQNTNDAHTRLVDPDVYMGDNIGRRKGWDERVIEAEKRRSYLPTLYHMAAHIFEWTEVDIYLSSLTINDCTGEQLYNRRYECEGSMAEWFEQNPPIYYERNIRYMIVTTREEDVEFLMLTWAYNPDFKNRYSSQPEYIAAFEEHNRIMEELATEYDKPFYDFAADMPMDREFWTDGRHLTEAGNAVKAELLAEQIVQMGLISEPDN